MSALWCPKVFLCGHSTASRRNPLKKRRRFSQIPWASWNSFWAQVVKNPCIALHCIALHCIVMHCIALHCIALHCIAVHCMTFHCIALHCIASHCISFTHGPSTPASNKYYDPHIANVNFKINLNHAKFQICSKCSKSLPKVPTLFNQLWPKVETHGKRQLEARNYDWNFKTRS